MKTNETIEITDLTLTEDQQAEVKGGPIGDQVTWTYMATNTSPAEIKSTPKLFLACASGQH